MKLLLFFLLLSQFAQAQIILQGTAALAGQVKATQSILASGCAIVADSHTALNQDLCDLDKSGNDWSANKFTSAGAYTLCAAELELSKFGSPTYSHRVHIYTDSSGSPGTEVGMGSVYVPVSGYTTATTNYVMFTGMEVSMVSGTVYWMVIEANGAGDASNYTQWGTDQNFVSANTKVSSDGTSWSGHCNRIAHYKLYSP